MIEYVEELARMQIRQLPPRRLSLPSFANRRIVSERFLPIKTTASCDNALCIASVQRLMLPLCNGKQIDFSKSNNGSNSLLAV